MKKETWFFLILAYAIAWLVWITAELFGVGPDRGEYIAAFGVAGPALAAVFLSRRGQDGSGERLSTRLLSFALLWFFAWAVYIANDRLRGIHAPTSIPYYLLVGLLAAIPAWILSGAFTRDPGVRELLHSLVHPDNWRWQVVAFFFWPAILLIPAAIAHLFHAPLTLPQHRDTIWLSTAYGGIAFLNAFLFTAALEEPGWRGFLLPRLQQRFSPLLASLLVWFPWTLWRPARLPSPLSLQPGGLLAAPRRFPHPHHHHPHLALQPFRRQSPHRSDLPRRHEHLSFGPSLLSVGLSPCHSFRRHRHLHRAHVAPSNPAFITKLRALYWLPSEADTSPKCGQSKFPGSVDSLISIPTERLRRENRQPSE
jgi:membrane protease YdiL (CAAX protease family)